MRSTDGKNVTVLFHASCQDGFCAAWLLHGVFPQATFVPVQYGDPPPHLPDLRGKDVYIVDFSYPANVLRDMAAQAHYTVVLDHHASAERELTAFAGFSALENEGGVYVGYDKERSGAQLTWDYITQVLVTRGMGSRPWLVDITQDRDLWKWELPNSRQINAAVRSYRMDFEIWNAIARNGPYNYINEGQAILRAQQQLVDQHVARATTMQVLGVTVPSVNATMLQSEIGEVLCAGAPFAVTWMEADTGDIVLSFRSDAQGRDVSEIARQFGGGGHAHAAGARVDRNLLLQTKE